MNMNAMTESMLPIVRQAGKAIMDIYQDETLFQTEYKKDHSPLTEADKRSNTIICEALAELYPDIPVISEENKQASYAIRSGYDRYFLVDPLDGTREFIKRNGEFTINIAYLEGIHPMAGYVHIPVKRKTYIGEEETVPGSPMRKAVRMHSPPFRFIYGIKAYRLWHREAIAIFDGPDHLDAQRSGHCVCR
jgi:3'(2'),5'-bisphosphate nucleotidase